MDFEAINKTIFAATNSLKEVLIKYHADKNGWVVYTPEGRLLDNFLSAGPFISFEAAKRNAEVNVGFKTNWGGL